MDDVRIRTNLVPCLYHVIVDDVRVLTILELVAYFNFVPIPSFFVFAPFKEHEGSNFLW